MPNFLEMLGMLVMLEMPTARRSPPARPSHVSARRPHVNIFKKTASGYIEKSLDQDVDFSFPDYQFFRPELQKIAVYVSQRTEKRVSD